MSVRAAQPCDLRAVLDIAKAGFGPQDRFGPGWLVDTLAEPGTRLLVESPGAGVVRGFLLVQRYPTGAVVRYVAVGPVYRQQGVGRRLLARVRGPATAWVRSANLASQGLFRSAGWRTAIAPRRRRGDWAFFVQGGPEEPAG